ncbi:MAG: hypothetical protein U9Q73_02645 [Nanoarchaeota archaeon]|nr:hypothetical protein [Nanoarchaeota archaeon]
MRIEVEIRGKIDDFEDTLKRFQGKANFIEEKDRISFIYFREGKDPEDVDSIREDPVDLKLRVTNKSAEMVMKYGRWGVEESRKEFLFPFELEKFGSALEFFKHLNWSRGVLMDTKTYLFEYKGVEFALVKSGETVYFEAEILVNNPNEVKDAIEKIKKICIEVNLEIFEEGEFIEMMNNLNKRKDRIFDMQKENFKDIKDKFEEFF